MGLSSRTHRAGRRRGLAALFTAAILAGLAATPVLAAVPVANDGTDSVRESKPLDIFLDATDGDFDALTYTITNPPDHGGLTDCSEGFCTYTPAAGYVGADSFQWKANDGTTDSNTATFSITVTANVAPVAVDDTATAFVSTPTLISFNATDDDGDDLTAVVQSGPTHGALSDCSFLSCTYTPTTGFSGTDTITWRANDGLANSNTATLTITVRAPECAIAPGVCIDQGVIRLGINPQGHLNVNGETASSGGTLPVGLRYLPTGAESTAPGCLCEGWGAADAISGATGSADVDVGGVTGLTLTSFSHTASTAVSVVEIGTTLRVTHDFHPSVNQDLYQVDVTIENISSAVVDARYRRVMDWDVEPTAFSEFVTIETGGSTALLFDSDDGFASPDPLAGPSSINFTGEAVDNGPADHGALFDFGLGNLDPGKSTTFHIFYGGAGTEAAAKAAITQVHGEVWSLGQPSTTDGPTLGTPNTFIFAFAGVGGTPQNTPPVAVDDTGTTPMGTPVGVPVLANDSDADGDTLAVTTVTDPAHGTASINLDGTVTYTPDAGYTGTDTFEYTISDGHGGTDTGLVTITITAVENPAPTVDAGGPYTGTEGSATSLDGTVANTPGTDTVTQTWSYTLGAGTDAGMTCSFGNANAVDTTITCTDDGTVTVKLTASDGVNPPVEDTATLTIGNANPSVSITTPGDGASFAVGATVNVSATLGDAGANDTHTCSIDWGDGTVTAGVVASGTCTGSHAYSGAGGKTITVTVTDDDNGTGSDTVGITITAVENPAPTVDAGGPYTGTEGSATSLDGTVANTPGTDTVTQTWSYTLGAGTDAGMTCSFGNANAVDTTITCTDDGTVTVKLTASDGVNPPVEDTATLTIGNANPSVSITTPGDGASFAVGATVNVSATLGDAGANDTHTCSIDWGDGTVTAGVVASGTCTGSHAYSGAGGKTITVTVTDDDNGTGSDTVGITITAVENPAPTVDAGGPYTGTEGSATSLDGTVANTPGTDTVTQTWSYTLGAGTDAGMTCSFGNANAVDTTITCTDDGTVTVKLTASDGVNPPVEDTATLTIGNANPSVSITTPGDGASFAVGATVNVSATLGDAGANDTHTCSIDWGDGTVTAGVVASGTCTGSHAYSGIAAPTIKVTVTDDDTGTGSDEVLITISEATTKVTGGGWITAGGLKVRFGFVAQPGDPPQGELQLRWGKHRFHGKTVTSLVADTSTATWTGEGKYDRDAGYTYAITVVDNGNGGGRTKTRDTFAIEIRDSGGTVVYTASGSLGGGNIKVH